MGLEAIRELNRAVPFRPCTVRLTSGAKHRVPHPDFIAIAPGGAWVVISDEKDHPCWISTRLIEVVSPVKSKARKR